MSKTSRIGKHLLARKVGESVGRTLTISPVVKYSPNHIALYAGERGKVISYDIGEGEGEDMLLFLEVVLESGVKKKKTVQQIWVNALDVSDLIG